LKTLFVLLVIYLAYIVLKGVILRGRFDAAARKRAGAGGGRTGGEPPRPEREDTAEVTVEDPVCGSFVPVSAALSTSTPQGTVYFCSPECRDKFEKDRGG